MAPVWTYDPLLHFQLRETACKESSHNDFQETPEQSAEQRQEIYELTPKTSLVITIDRYDQAGGIPWQGHAALINRRTGRHRRLKGLTRLLNRLQGYPSAFELSPRRTWLLWQNCRTFDNWPNPVAAKLDGTHYRSLDLQSRESLIYWLDEQHLVEEDLNYSDGKPLAVIIRNLANPRLDREFDAGSAQGKAIIKRLAIIKPC